ncbi:MAG: DUF998 domain-containing protein [Candidatus Lokiarchaeota archaeon]|nr:DUF998 domain-containing protein [Candidatus Lokiarchaeota archaeon]
MNNKNLKKWIFIYGIISHILYIILISIAMIYYPGGNQLNPDTIGYSFFTNFLSDLGGLSSHSGESNVISYSISVSANLLVISSAFLIYLVFFNIVKKPEKSRHYHRLASSLAMISCIFLSIAGIIPWDFNLYLHLFFTFTSFLIYFLAPIFYAKSIVKNKKYPNLYAKIFIVLFIVMTSHFFVLLLAPGAETQYGLLIRGISQKILVFTWVIVIICEIFGGLKVYNILKRSDTSEAL